MLVKEGKNSMYCAKEENICHGSRYTQEATIYRPKVDTVEMIISRNVALFYRLKITKYIQWLPV